MKMSTTQQITLPAKFDPKQGGRLLPTIGWYNKDYWLVNGLLLKGQAYSALCDLINQGACEDLGDALRQAVILLLIDKAKYLAKERGMLGIFDRIQKARDPGNMAPDETGLRKVKRLEEMYAKLKDDP